MSRPPGQNPGEVALPSPSDLDQPCCVICLEPLALAQRARCEPCGHNLFDLDCLNSWLLDCSYRSCPLCKETVREMSYSTATDQLIKVAVSPPRKPRQSAEAIVVSQLIPSRPFPRSIEQATARALVMSRDLQGLRAARRFETALKRRRLVYINRRFSKHVGANRVSGYQELTPARFNGDPALQSRARMWLRRELQVFPWLVQPDGGAPTSSASSRPAEGQSDVPDARQDSFRNREVHAERLIELIIAMLKAVDIRGSAGQAVGMIKDYLGRAHAELLLHELAAWLRSPLSSLEGWDAHVQYDPLLPGPRPAPSRRGNEPGSRDGERMRQVSSERFRREGSAPHDMPSRRRHGVQRRQFRRVPGEFVRRPNPAYRHHMADYAPPRN